MKDESKEMDIKNDKNNEAAIVKYKGAPEIVFFLSFLIYPAIIFYLAYQLKNNDFITYLNRFLAFSFTTLGILAGKCEILIEKRPEIVYLGYNISQIFFYICSFIFLMFFGFLIASAFLMFVFI